MKQDLKMYIVDGTDADENWYTEYFQASTPQIAVDRARECHSEEGYEVVQVARIIHNWK